MSLPTEKDIRLALDKVMDPEIHRPITQLNMVRGAQIEPNGKVTVDISLTTAGCPLQDTIEKDVVAAVAAVPGVTGVSVRMGEMTDEEKQSLREKLSGGAPQRVVPFAQPDNLTRVYAISSGKGGVGKSSMTANLAGAMARQGLKVGVVDADIYGFSIPQMFGVKNPPQAVDSMIIPPVAHGVKAISIGMFMAENTPVIWRGPMLHRAIEQFFADVFWGDLDVLLIDLPPGTGDVALSVAQLIPKSQIVVVTTPQVAAAEVAERAGIMAGQTEQEVVGVIENMSYLQLPDGSTMDLFGSGGGETVAKQLSEKLGYEVPLLAQVPLEKELREGGDSGMPITLSDPDSPAAQAISRAAAQLTQPRGLAGKSLGVDPV
ncbi:MAG: Mrp/NBP35 family ATP-binding protein [Trueperella sp.]|nr:Mrp/NBP35 family ATP-binding protein [Trueperella sp.]